MGFPKEREVSAEGEGRGGLGPTRKKPLFGGGGQVKENELEKKTEKGEIREASGRWYPRGQEKRTSQEEGTQF